MIPQAKTMTTDDFPWEKLPPELKLMITNNFLFPSATSKQRENYLCVNKQFHCFFQEYRNKDRNTVPLIATFNDNKLTIKLNPNFEAENTDVTAPEAASAAFSRTLKIVSDEKIFSHQFGSYVNSNLLPREHILEYSIAGMNANYNKPTCIAFKKLLNILAQEKLISLNDLIVAEKAIDKVENTIINNATHNLDTSIRNTLKNLFPS